jgi:hypothetical protein
MIRPFIIEAFSGKLELLNVGIEGYSPLGAYMNNSSGQNFI